jgi:hypothetical protein
MEVEVRVRIDVRGRDSREFDPDTLPPADPRWQKLQEAIEAAVRNALADALTEGFRHPMEGAIALRVNTLAVLPPRGRKVSDPDQWVVPAVVEADNVPGLRVEFDAGPWFRSAALAEVKELADNGWGGCDEADAVARWVSTSDPDLARFFDILSDLEALKHLGGFACHVSDSRAVGWLRQNRTGWADQLGLGR